MRVFLDDQPLAASPSLAAAIAAARSEAERRGRVIVDILRDGRPLPGELLSDPTNTPEPDTAELRCESTDPRALVAESLRQAAAALTDSRERHIEAGRLIQSGSLDAVMPLLAQALEAWTQAHRVVTDGLALLSLEPDAVDRALTPAITTLSERLAEVKRTLKAQDWSGLADALAYDLPAEIDRWVPMLRGLADRVARIG